jgi:HD-like signal output (HDOD) protein
MGRLELNRQADLANGSMLSTLKARVGELATIPTLPDAALKAMAALKEPHCSLVDLAEIVRKDPALTAGILRLANSALYRISRTIQSIDQAVVRLGTRECQNLILTVSMQSMFRRADSAQRVACERLWKHSLLTASLCRRLNDSLALGFAGEEFACGIGHDLGRILIVLVAFEAFQQADPLDFEEGPDILQREQDVLGTDHCFFGAWYASMNQLPASMISAVQFHHLPSEAGERQPLVALVSTADHMANYLLRGLSIGEYSPGVNTGLPFLADRLTDRQKAWLDGNAHALMESVAEEVGGIISPAA